jgi:hypothetical protein
VTPAHYQVLDSIADAFDPLLALAALGAPWLRRPIALRTALLYYLSGGAAVGLVYVIRALDARYQLWTGAGLDYSTHSAFAAAVATSLAAFDRRWLWPLLVALLLYFSLVLFMRYHRLLDVASSALIAAAGALVLSLVSRPKTQTSAKHVDSVA